MGCKGIVQSLLGKIDNIIAKERDKYLIARAKNVKQYFKDKSS